MTAVEEPPLPTAGPWALPASVRFGVVGDAGVASRLGRVVPTRTIRPRDGAREVCREVDAVLLELSAFERATGAWAHALRPGGFDRGGALAQLLRVARVFERPVLGIDDRADDDRDGWQQVLGAALDDVAALGPVVAGAPSWNPGLHWSAVALAVPPTADPGRPATAAREVGWAAAQRAAVVTGGLAVDTGDPWQRHLGVEVAALGVPVTAADTGAAVGVADSGAGAANGVPDPHAALELLCDRLGLTPPRGAPPLVVADTAVATPHEVVAWDTLGRNVVVATDRVVLLARPGASPTADDLAAAAAALDRARDAVAVRAPDVVAVRARVLRTLGPVDAALYDRAERLAGAPEVGA